MSDHVLKGYDSVCDYVFKFENKIIKELSVSEKEKLFTENKKVHDQHYSFSLPQGEPVFKLKNTQIFQNRRLLNQTELFIQKPL